jgi:hypothetical protein
VSVLFNIMLKPVLVLMIATGALVWMHIVALLVEPHLFPIKQAIGQWYRNERSWRSLMWKIEDTPIYLPRGERNRVRR